MADYNVNMKQWNGTSFDNVLPLAYNAKQLGGQSLAEVKQWVQENNLLLYTGQYTGTGTYGASHPTSVTFPFEPVLFFFPSELITLFANSLSTTEDNIFVGSVYYVNIKKSADGKTISWYSDSSASEQYNDKGKTFYYAAIGGYDIGGQTEWTITKSGTWIVPKTGRYYIELYGGGGSTTLASRYQGGSSCQIYDSISLTRGNDVNITIGKGLNSSQSGTRGGTTTFGQYSVLGGEKGSDNAGGAGSGNKGTNGQYADLNTKNYSTGRLGKNYGYGINGAPKGYTSGGPGAVYIKYLGA